MNNQEQQKLVDEQSILVFRNTKFYKQPAYHSPTRFCEENDIRVVFL